MRKVTKPREPRGRVRFLSDDERTRLLEACKQSSNEFLYPAVVLAISTGLRRSELMHLKWDDVSFERKCIILQETKNGERHSVPIRGLALQLLIELHDKCKTLTPLIFPGKIPNKPIDLQFSWERALKAAQIENFSWHCLRHSTASYLAMNGASLIDIAKVLNHKTLAMVKRYSHLSETHTAGVIESMNEKIFGEV